MFYQTHSNGRKEKSKIGDKLSTKISQKNQTKQNNIDQKYFLDHSLMYKNNTFQKHCLDHSPLCENPTLQNHYLPLVNV